ncbi:MAG TPA: glycosyltransferase family 4 protein [Flavobacterium sp.]|nr:glycosyltransferase family 4 protein [Flavobacterium sp.]
MKNLLYIGNKLSKHGYSVTSIETLGPLLETAGFSLAYASEKKNKPLRLYDMLLKTASSIKKSDYILIDTYSTSNFWYAFLISQLARLLKIKYLPILHGGNLPKRLQANAFCSRLIFKNAFKNIAPSKYLQHEFATKGFETLYIPNAIEIKKYHFRQRDNIKPRLLWVRAFDKIYNPQMAIEVFKIVRENFAEASLCMVGPDKDGSLGRAKELADKYGLPVVFTGRLPKAEWLSLAADYDIFLNTTHFDNMPVSVIEAMALGLPIVSTSVGGIPYLLENNADAILVEDGAVEEMASAIMKLCGSAELAVRLCAAARKKVLAFDWDEVKEAWKKTFA